MPYRAYNPTNSSLVPAYVGNSLSEYKQLMDVKQQQYDTGFMGDQESLNALNQMSALAKDQPALKQIYDASVKEINDRAAKGNYEDFVPEVLMGAKKMAAQYRPFAEVINQRSQYLQKLKEQRDSGKITEQQYFLAQKASDFTYPGLKKDPLTGRYTGSYSGMPVMESPDVAQIADDALKDYAKRTNTELRIVDGKTYTYVGGRKVEELTPQRIEQIIQGRLASDKNVQQYLQNLSQLKWAGDDEKINILRGASSMDSTDDAATLSQVVGKSTRYEKVKGKVVPVSVEDTVASIRASGKTVGQYLREKELANDFGALAQQANAYAIPKYSYRNEEEIIRDLQESVASKDARSMREAEGYGDNFTTSAGYNLDMFNKPNGLSPSDLAQVKQDKNTELQALANDIKMYDNPKEYSKQNGKIFNKAGVDITNEVRTKQAQFEALASQTIRINQLDAELKDKYNVKVTPEVSKKIDKEVQAEADRRYIRFGIPMTATDKEAFRNKVTDEQLAVNNPAYKQYKKELAQKTASTAITSFVVGTTNKKGIDAINNFISVLGTGGSKKSGITLRYPVFAQQTGAATVANTQLSASEWNKISGDLESGGLVPISRDKIGIVLKPKPGASKEARSKIPEGTIVQVNLDANTAKLWIKDPVMLQEVLRVGDLLQGLEQGFGKYSQNGITYESVTEQNGAKRWKVVRDPIQLKDGTVLPAKGGTYDDLLTAMTELSNNL